MCLFLWCWYCFPVRTNIFFGIKKSGDDKHRDGDDDDTDDNHDYDGKVRGW